jgi:propanol-preferring alcohol dehydrogenase
VKRQYPGSRILVFTRSAHHRDLARALGADWTSSTEDEPPSGFDCAIDFTPVGSTVRDALAGLRPGGRLVINAIRKRDPIPPLDYAAHLWHEKEIKSVTNVTRRDAEEFLLLAAAIPIVPEVEVFSLEEANEALVLLKQGALRAAAVLTT